MNKNNGTGTIEEYDKKIAGFYTKEDILCKIEEVLELEDQNPALKKIIEEILAAPGKLLRPRLLLAVSSMREDHSLGKARAWCPGFETGLSVRADPERDLTLGAVVEIIHMASLVHDDIIDDSPLRRGRPSIQGHFGKDMAVYTGDFLLARSVRSLFEKGYMEEGILVTRAIEDMCNGELFQYQGRFDPGIGIPDYIKTISGKTAALFRLSASLGCMSAGISGDMGNDIPEFAYNLGVLFQIRDDLLDFELDIRYGDHREGKPSLMDFQSGILTLPVICALESDNYKKDILQLLETAKKRELSREDTDNLKTLIHSSGGFKKCKEIFREYAQAAERSFVKLPDWDQKAVLQGFLEKLTV